MKQKVSTLAGNKQKEYKPLELHASVLLTWWIKAYY